MLVKFKTNLGSRDAAKFGLDHSRCGEGASVEVGDELGAKLLLGGFVVDVTPPAKPVAIRAVPVVEVTEAKPMDLETKEPAAKPKGNKKPSE